VLRLPDQRAALIEALSDVDRLVLLGDVLELRHGPSHEALAAARPVFEDLGRALAGRELIVLAGNHDHALVEPWLARRGEDGEAAPLGVEQHPPIAELSPMAGRLAEWAAPATLRVAYPGLRVREDVFATHGHYLDCHLTLPTLERLSLGVMSRALGRPAATFAAVDDYEAVSAPLFAWRDAASRSTRPGGTLNGMATADAWRALGGAGKGAPGVPALGGDSDRPKRSRGQALAARLRRRALIAAFPAAVAALNRAGIGELRGEISGEELRRAGLAAMREVAARLGVDGGYVVFGHTHRPGPLPGDDTAEWGRLVNSGSWTYSPVFLTPTPGESPYWPGTGVLVEGSGPPRVISLLGDRRHEDLLRRGPA
jgi:predicted phosphodiesterase